MKGKNLEMGLAGANNQVKKLNANLTKTKATAASSFGAAVKSALSLERVINRLAFIGTVGLVFALGAALKDSIGGGVKAAQDLELQMRHVFTVMDRGLDVLEEFKASVKDISVKFVQKMEQVSGALYDIISARLGEQNALTVLAESAKLATANMADMRDVANTVISILNSYNIAGTEVNRISDLLQKTIKVGKMEMSDFASTIGKVIPQAAAYNIKLSEMFGVLATMTNQGMKAREAVTSMNRAITAWSQNAELSSILQQKGIRGVIDILSLMDTQQQKTLSGGVRGVKALNAFMNNYAKTLENIEDIQNSSGSTQEAFLKQTNSLAFKINKNVERNRMLWEKAGEALLPVKGFLVDILAATSDIITTVITMPKTFYSLIDSVMAWASGYEAVKKDSKEIIDLEREMIELSKSKTQEDMDRFNVNRGLSKFYNDIKNSAEREIEILEKKKKIELAYGRDVVRIQQSILSAQKDRLSALNQLLVLGNNYSDNLDDIYDTQLAIAELSNSTYWDWWEKTDFGKFSKELSDFFGTTKSDASEVKAIFDSLLSGAKVSISGGVFDFSDYISGIDNFSEKIKTSREVYDNFVTYLLSKTDEGGAIIAKFFKKFSVRPPALKTPDLTEFEKYTKSLSTAFEKNNRVAEFVQYMKELDGILGTAPNESLIRFLNGKEFSGEAKKKLDEMGISADDLKAKMYELGLSTNLFYKLFNDPDNINKTLAWFNTIKTSVEEMATSFEDFIASETAAWARMLMEGEDATKAFANFFDRLMAQMLANFTSMVTKMILQWAFFKLMGVGDNPFSNTPAGWHPPMSGAGGVGNRSINPQISIPGNLANAINRTPNIINQNNITLSPIFTAKFDRRSAAFIINEGNSYNKMGNL